MNKFLHKELVYGSGSFEVYGSGSTTTMMMVMMMMMM
jgi:hypothetical protein